MVVTKPLPKITDKAEKPLSEAPVPIFLNEFLNFLKVFTGEIIQVFCLKVSCC